MEIETDEIDEISQLLDNSLWVNRNDEIIKMYFYFDFLKQI